MKKRSTYLAGYVCFWLAYFLFFKAVFLLYHQSSTIALDPTTISGIFFFGAQLDLVAILGICLLPMALISLSIFHKQGRWLSKSLLIYTNSMLILLTMLCTTDLELYRIWGFRLDASPLMYLNTPSEMFISMGASPIRMLIILNTLINLFFCFAYRFTLHPLTFEFKEAPKKSLPAYRLTATLLIIPMIGGISFLPEIRRNAGFSTHHFANQATTNVPLNFAFSIHQTYFDRQNPYKIVEEQAADSLRQAFYPPGAGKRQQLVRNSKPNVVLIIWESFTAKATSELNGLPNVTPEFSRLSQEGLLFSRVYASGDRSDKGLAAILSGYPAQPGSSILKYPEKTPSLPHLSKSLKKAGYHTSFYYGGDLAFARFNHYLELGKLDEIISKRDFRPESLASGRNPGGNNSPENTSAWGAHDHVVFQKLLQDMGRQQEPFFKTIFTLSSHEPFDIPAEPKFKGKSVSSRLLSSLHYTDSILGSFIRQAKRLSCYDNTLFIVVADHGHTYPGGSRVYEPEKFHIPMLWFGGALQQAPETISKTMSQTDLAATLLGQLGLSAEDFPWSKDILLKQSPAYAHYFFKDGVGFVTDSSYLVFDNVSRKPIEQQGTADSSHLSLARTYLQLTYGDYLNK